MEPRRLRPRHLGVAGAALLLSCATAFWLGSLQQEEIVGGFKPTQMQTTNGQVVPGYAVERWKVPTRFRVIYLALMAGCLGGVGLLAVVADDEGNTLLDLETLAGDIPDTVLALSHAANQLTAGAIQEGVDWALISGKRTAKFVFLRTAPTPIKDWVKDLERNNTWLSRFYKVHKMKRIVGRSRGGKTTIALAVYAHCLEASNGEIDINICDRNYGKPNEEGEINDWLGTPLAYIHDTDEKIEAALDAEFEHLETRIRAYKSAAKPGGAPVPPELKRERLFVIDEQDSTQEELNDGEGVQGPYSRKLKRLLDQGAGYGMGALIVGQELSVKESGISRALRSKMSTLMVSDYCLKPYKVQDFGIPKEDYDPLIEQCKRLRRANKRWAIVELGDADPVVVVVPDLSHVQNIRVAIEAPQDADLIWWTETYTPDVQMWLEDLARRYTAKEIKSPLKLEVCVKFGVRLDNRDTRYRRFVRPAWESALNKAQTNLQEKSNV